MNKQWAWKIFDESSFPQSYWETENSGLLLSICNKCGEKQTRATYLNGFWVNFFTLIQDYSITAIAQHICGQWHKISC